MTVQPFVHTTPDEVLVETSEQLIQVPFRDGRIQQFRLVQPISIDTLLDHPATYQAFAQDEYLPYWAELWPSALMLGQTIAQQSWPAKVHVLEIGCGLGFSGLVALALGMQVIFSDYDTAALDFAARNAELNGYKQFRLLPLDWRCPPPSLQVPLILAADVIYEARNIQPLIQFMVKILLSGGECWLADPDRPHKEEFQAALITKGFEFETIPKILERAKYPTVYGTVYRIWHPAGTEGLVR